MSELGDNKLKKLQDPRQVSRILLTAKERQQEVHVSRFVGDQKVLAPARLELILPLRREIVVSPLPGREALFAHVVGASETVNFFIPSAALLFQCRVRKHSEDGLQAHFPDFLAQLERRKWLRMPGDERIRIQFNKPLRHPRPGNHFFAREAFDLSAGGASFVVSRAEAKFFTPGESFKGLELIINGRKNTFVAQVVRIQEVPQGDTPYPTWRVSVRFVDIDTKTQESLSKFVFANLGDQPLAV